MLSYTRTITIILLLFAFGCSSPTTVSRTFDLRYVTHVKTIPAGTKRLRVWVPVPQDNPQQAVSNLQFNGPYKPRLTTEAKYGNRFAFYEISNPAGPFELEFTCRVRRTEDHGNSDSSGQMLRLYLKPNRMVPRTDEIRKQAAAIAKDAASIRARGRAFYDHVLNEMAYDKSGSGWGRGDFKYACDVGRGNCTDFHAYFIGLCRNDGIPARFEIGLTIPEKKGKTGGYHCWAYFWDGSMWVPVDISEADKHPEKANYYFGSHCPNRVTFTRGRDLVLQPAQAGKPLNFIIYPYAEADGKPIETSKTSFVNYSN